MKKALVLLAIVAAIMAAAIAGYKAGQQNVIQNQTPWILDYDKPEGADFNLYMEINGEWHLYNGFIG